MDRPKGNVRTTTSTRLGILLRGVLLSLLLAASSFASGGDGATGLSLTQQHGPGSLEVPRLDPQRIYSLTPDGRFTRSEDGGETWLEVPPLRGEGLWSSLAVWQEDPFRVVASTRRGRVAISQDGGETFDVRGRQELDATAALTLDPDDPWTVYADGAQGVLRSEDGGVSWETVWQGGFARFAMDRSQTGATSKQWIATCRLLGGVCLAVDLMSRSQDGTWEVTGTCELLRELDAETQQKLKEAAKQQPPPRPIHRLQYDGDLWLSTWVGLYRIASFGSSCHPVRGLRETLRIGRGPGSRRDLWAISPKGLYRIDEHRLRARRSSLPGEAPLSSATASPNGLFAQRSDASVLGYLSREGWQWLQRPLSLNTGLHRGEPSPKGRVPSTGEPRAPGDPLMGLHLNNHVGAVLLHPDHPRRMYAGSLRGLFVSLDGGHSWTDRSEGLVPANVHALAYDRQRQRLWAGTHGGGLYVSRDEGRSWLRRSVGLEHGAVQDVWIHPEDSNLMTATVSRRVYFSRDGGERWRRIGQRSGQSFGSARQAILWGETVGEETVLGLPWRGSPKIHGDSSKTHNRRAIPTSSCAIASPRSFAQSQPRRMLWDPEEGHLHLATDRGLWTQAWDVDEHPEQPCGTWTAWPGELILQDLALSEEGRIYGASSQGLWSLPVAAADDAGWQRFDLPDPQRPIYSVDVGPGAAPVVMAGSDRGAVLISHDGGNQWSLQTVPTPVPIERLREVRRSPGSSLPDVKPLPKRAEVAAKIKRHVESLPPSAHREELRWRLERFGLLNQSFDGALDDAASTVRRDAASQIRRTGGRGLWLDPTAEWLMSDYLFDDGDTTHHEMRIYDLSQVAWDLQDTHAVLGASRGWHRQHDLDREPVHLLPRWQWNDGGNLLAASPKARALVTWNQDNEVVLWSLRRGDDAEAPVTDDGAVARPKPYPLGRRSGSGRPWERFSPDGHWLVSSLASKSLASQEGEAKEVPGPLKLWNLYKDAGQGDLVFDPRPLETTGQLGMIREAVWHPRLSRLTAVTADGELLEVSLEEDRAVVRPLPWSGGRLEGLVWSPDETWLAALTEGATTDGKFDLWLWKAGRHGNLDPAAKRLASGVFGPLHVDATGRWLGAQRREDLGLSLWHLSAGSSAPVPDLGPTRIFHAFLNGNRVMVEHRDQVAGDIEIWRLDRGPELLEELRGGRFVASSKGITRVDTRPKHQFLTVGSEGRKNPGLDGRWITLEAHPGGSYSLTLQGTTLIVGEPGGQLDLWRLDGEVQRARVQIGRYDRANDAARPLEDAFADLFAMLPEIAWQDLSREERRRRFCALAGGGPSRDAWRRVLPKTPYRPWCGPPAPPSGR